MADTANFGWTKPTPNGDNNAWGVKLNTLFDDVDTDLKAVSDVADAASASASASAGTLAAATAHVKYIGFAAFQPNADEDDVTYGAGGGAYLESDDDTGSEFYAPFSLPPGVQLDSVSLLCDKNGLTSVTVTPQSINASTGAMTPLGTGTRSASGIGLATTAALAYVTGAEFLQLHVTASGSLGIRYRIYGAIINYTRTGLTQTD